MGIPQLLAGSQLIAQDNDEFTVNFHNPLDSSYVGLPPAGTLLPSDDGGNPPKPIPPGMQVLSISPDDGTPMGRKLGTNGSWERCKKDGKFLVWTLNGKKFTLPFLE